MPHRRKFLNKKNSITFQLVHRSQHDPLIVDDTVGERVLVPLGVDQRKVEQLKFGIEYDDDYDYLQHLRDPCAPPEEYSVYVDQTKKEEEEEEEDDEDNAISRFNLPSTVFESKTTNEIGMLNLAAPDSDPKIHWDPDVIAALDDDEFDYDANENAIDDDFMLKANGIQPLADDECDEFEDEILNEILPTSIPPRFVPKTNKPIPLALRRFLDQDDEDDNNDDMESNFSHNDDDKQTSKTKYTNYSMTSSVIRRNQGLQNIDEHFDKVFDEYDDQNWSVRFTSD
jgi:protein LTV1